VRGGRAAHAEPSEIEAIRGELAALYADVLSGEAERGRAAVGAQIQNVRLRCIELERRIAESDELFSRLSALEERLTARGA